MRKLLVTGANGMLGSSIRDLLQSDFEVIAGTRDNLNIVDYRSVKSFIESLRPDLVIHAAAYTNVEEAEKKPEDCYQANYIGTLNLVNAIRPHDSKFIYVSSTGCYGAYKDTPYAEYDDVIPTTVYHKSKYLGELVVKEMARNFLILRTGWLFGGSDAHKKNFVVNRFKEASKTEKIVSDPFQVGNPTRVENVAEQIRLLIQEDVCGTFNMTANNYCTRYEYVKFIVEQFNLNCSVEKSEQPFKRLAAVSPNEAAINFNLDSMGLSVMKDWKESLKDYINELR